MDKVQNHNSFSAVVHHCVQTGSGAHPQVPGAFLLGVKRPEPEDAYSLQFSVEVKNARSYTSILPYVFMAWYSVKHRVNFTFYCVVTSIRSWCMHIQNEYHNNDILVLYATSCH
jgi:hypothetical protein